jgi:hypothetical protein
MPPAVRWLKALGGFTSSKRLEQQRVRAARRQAFVQEAGFIVKGKSEGVKIALNEQVQHPMTIAPSSHFASPNLSHSRISRVSAFAPDQLGYPAFISELLAAKAADNSNSAVGIRVALRLYEGKMVSK